jgi:branched-chain amino acid transport system permease protein
MVLVVLRSTEESWLGQAWAAIRDSDALASSLGYNVAAMKRWAFFAAAALAGVSGSLAAQMLGVVDPTLYAATVSLGMFVAVLIGSRLGFFGPFLGIAVIGGLPILAGNLMPSASTAPARGVAVAGLTIVALMLSLRGGLRQGAPPPSVGPDMAVKASRRRRGASRGEPQVVATGISRNFGGVQALDSVDLEVNEGELHALIGPNGSGKSTLLKCLAGSIPADSGHVLLGGSAVDEMTERERSRAGLVRTFQRVVLMPDLNPRQHLELGLATRSEDAGWLAALLKTPGYRASAAERRNAADSLLETFGLGAFADADPQTVPGGRQRLLQVATAVATGPRVLLLDEPAAGMSQPDLEVLAGALERLRQGGLTIVVVEHNIGFVKRIADRVSVLDGGRMLATGTPRQVVANRRVRAAYLGGATTPRA